MDFLLAYSRVLDIDEDSMIFNMYCYVLERASQSASSSQRYSKLAACTIILANFCLPDDVVGTLWPKKLLDASGWTLEFLRGDVVQLSSNLERIRAVAPQLDIIDRRYRKPCRYCVTDIPISVLTERALLAYERRTATTTTTNDDDDDDMEVLSV